MKSIVAFLVCAGLAVAPDLAVAASEPATRDCAWHTKISGDQINAAFPDEAAKYWNATLPIPPGGHIEIKGRFPHARYMSVHIYEPRLRAVDAIADVEIEPDKGSRNPFLHGADRTRRKRSYTLRIVNARIPRGGRAPNTLYTENADGSRSTRGFSGSFFTLRVYEADLGRDDSGGVGLPNLAMVDAKGNHLDTPVCPAVTLPNPGLTEMLAAFGLAPALPGIELLGGADPPRWNRHFGALSSYVVGADGPLTASLPLAQIAARLPEAGLGENAHNKYVFAVHNRGHGEVLLLRGRAPTVPATLKGERKMGDGQLRYWSVCANLETTQYLACLNDDAIPVGRDGRYAIAISTAASRPANARERCGFAWLPTGPTPRSLLIMRHMLPRTDFAHAIQRIGRLGDERAVLGEYYPQGRYYARTADFQRLGCTGARRREHR